MKTLKLLSVILALLMLLSVFSGCKSENENKGNKSDETNAAEQSETEGKNEANEENELQYPDKMPEKLTVKKIGSMENNANDGILYNYPGSLRYKGENNLYGLKTYEGEIITEAKYTFCEMTDNEGHFVVSTVSTQNINNISSLNNFGLVDIYGNELIPMKYADIDAVNERYYRVIEITEITDNKDEALIYDDTDHSISLVPTEGDTYFKGKWYIYDVINKTMVEGAVGTGRNYYRIRANGNYITYRTDSGEEVTVNDKGELLPEGAKLFSDGCYFMEKAVYNSDHEKQFDVDLEGYIPYGTEDEYYIARRIIESKYKYVLMDKTGKIVSGEFDNTVRVYGSLIHCDKKIYNFEGENIIAGTYTTVWFEDVFGNAWFLQNDDTFTLIDKEGNILYQGTDDVDDVNINASVFKISKNIDGKDFYYTLKDKDFVVEGSYSSGTWMIEVEKPNGYYSIVDMISGETILSEYKDYYYKHIKGSHVYVYALKEDGGYDIYSVK